MGSKGRRSDKIIGLRWYHKLWTIWPLRLFLRNPAIGKKMVFHMGGTDHVGIIRDIKRDKHGTTHTYWEKIDG